jgi:hypothetical protein
LKCTARGAVPWLHDQSTDVSQPGGGAQPVGVGCGFSHRRASPTDRAAPEIGRRSNCLGSDLGAGINDRIFLANDWIYGLTIAPTGTMDLLKERNPSGNLFNVRNTIPDLCGIGVTDEQIRIITVTIPRAFFARS